jgi:CrcB protein
VIWVGVAVAGALGAACRYVLDHLITAGARGVFPWGTAIVNVTGSLLAGGVAGLTVAATLATELHLLVAGGFLGAYTTFSTAMYETVRLLEDGERPLAVVNLLAPLVLSTAAATLGFVLLV